jgi:hypothetical protein
MSDFYDIVHDGVRMVLPRVTEIITVVDINKADHLMGWATRLEREAIKLALEDALTTPDADMSPHAVWKRMEPTFSGKRAWVKSNREAINIGNAAHDIIRWHTERMLGVPNLGPEPSGPEGAMRAVCAWLDWCREVEFEPMFTERLVYCPWCAYAGTTDGVAKVRGALTTIDYKTGKAVYDPAHLQVAGYRHALAREGIATDGGVILRLPKTSADPDFEVVAARPIPHVAFRHALATWRLSRWLDGEETGSQKMQKCEVLG